MRIKKFVAPTLAVLLFLALFIQLPFALAARASDYDTLDPVIEVLHLLKAGYVSESKVDPQKMREAMIEGMVSTLNDPHTVYVPPSDEVDFNKEVRGSYVGIGAEINIINDYLVITSPMDGSPALQAGVMAGDVVLSIEGQSTYKMPVDKCISLLMGEPGTDVSIRVRHLDNTEQDLTITRQQIITRTVKGLYRVGGDWHYCLDPDTGIYYIHITQFIDSTYSELTDALTAIQNQGTINGLILDLRANPGGSLTSAIQISDLFLKSGTIVSVKPRIGDPHSWSAHEKGTLPDFPMVTLVNGFSASASEILSGALQENNRSKIMGTRTFGKGSVQEVRDLDFNMGTLKYTTALYYLPSGRNIQRNDDSTVWGVDPDQGFIVPISDEDYIAHLRAAREFEIIRTDAGNLPDCGNPQWIRDTLKDEMLADAVDAVKSKLNGTGWPSYGNKDASLVAYSEEVRRAEETRARLLEQVNQINDRITDLEKNAEAVGAAPLLPKDIDLLDGAITLTDKNGNVIGTYKIAGGDVELALGALNLTPVGAQSKPEHE
ncbi:MAG TPA: S41 family peptidase [Phycisphaerales bacterium]|nr:S41 family peptidase [Phycisphaerales bacterium]